MAHAVWEYLTLPENERERLGALGDAGWELVGVGGGADERVLYLKREAHDLRERVTLDQRNRYYASLGRDPHRQQGPSTE